MSSCVLPFSLNVESKTYQHTVFPLGIIKANIKDYDIWLCNKFINCIIVDGGYKFYEQDEWFYSEDLTVTQTVSLFPAMFPNKGIDLIQLCKEMLKAECYITGFYDEYYIRGKASYGKRTFEHDFLIFGFDDSERVFKSAGYLKDGQYQMYEISYESFYQSIVNLSSPSRLFFNHIKKQYLPRIDIPFIKGQLDNYLNSQGSTCEEKTSGLYGMKVWDQFVKYVEDIEEQKLDLRFGRLFMEHKAIMSHRINKLNELNYIHDVELGRKYYENVAIQSQIVHHLFIKYNLTGDRGGLFKLVDIIKRINADDERHLLHLSKIL